MVSDKIMGWLLKENKVEEEQLFKWRDPDNQKLFEGFKDFKGILDNTNGLTAQILALLMALNNGETWFEIKFWKFPPIKISLAGKVGLTSSKINEEI